MDNIVTQRISDIRATMEAIRKLYAGADDLEGSDELIQVLDFYCKHLESRRDGLVNTATNLFNIKMALNKSRAMMEQLFEDHAAAIGNWEAGSPVTNPQQAMMKLLAEMVESFAMGIFLIENNLDTPGLADCMDEAAKFLEQEREIRANRKKDRKWLKKRVVPGLSPKI